LYYAICSINMLIIGCMTPSVQLTCYHRWYDGICTINKLIIGCMMTSVQLTS